MANKPTPNQKQAIETIDRNVIVSAGAGSGKTRVLVERYIYLLQKRFAISDILAITFTRKAALEMKERIRQSLAANPALAHLADHVDQAQVSTIHSFCQGVIAEHPREANIDPRFRMAEEWESRGLLVQVVRDLVTAALATGQSGISALRDSFRMQQELIDYLCSVYMNMDGKGVEDYSEPDQSNQISQDIVIAQQELCHRLQDWLIWISTQKISTAKQVIIDQIQSLWDKNQAEFISLAIDLKQELLTELARLLGGNWAASLKEEVSDLKELANELKQLLFDKDANEHLLELSQLLSEINREYRQRKIAGGLLDFNDLERLAVRLLQDPSVKNSYQFQHVMVDEAQDTNLRQKQLIDILAGSDNTRLFIVGDPKQSIYRFRGAEVEVFIDSETEIVEQQGQRITMLENFRSRKGILDYVNFFFTLLMDKDAITYEECAPQRAAANNAEVQLLITEGEDRIVDGRVIEANQIAAVITDLVKNQGHEFRDITILMRAMTNAPIYERALQDQEIPFVNLSGQGFYDKQEIRDILNFITWLQDANDEISKIAVLRSPFFAVSDAGLFWYQADKWDNISVTDQQAISQAHELYPFLQQSLVATTAPRFIERLLASTPFVARTLALDRGQQRYANIEKFQATSWQLWSAGYISMFEQLDYIEQVVEQNGREAEARLDNENADVVTLMTIHGSKGLQFPVVILADLSAKLRLSDSSHLTYHPSLGLTIRDSTAYNKIKDVLRSENIAESKRLLYVAMTRAADKLILSGIGAPTELKIDGPLERLSSWWEWVLWGLQAQDSGEESTLVSVIELPEDATEQAESLVVATTDPGVVIGGTSEPLPQTYIAASFSVTSLMIYAQCPRRYYYRYILRVPELGTGSGKLVDGDGLNPLQRGNIVHRVCEKVDPQHSVDELLQWASAMEGISLTRAEERALRKIIDRYVASEYYSFVAAGQVEREVEFALAIEDYTITGTIDQILTADDGLAVIDLKTNHITPEQVQDTAASYFWQLRIYAWAVQQLKGQPVSKTQLYFLFPNIVHTDYDAQRLVAETEGWLRTTCTQIVHQAEHGTVAFPATDRCQYCPYKCEQVTDMQQNFVDLLTGLGRLEKKM